MDDTTAAVILAISIVGIVAICYLKHVESQMAVAPRLVTLQEVERVKV